MVDRGVEARKDGRRMTVTMPPADASSGSSHTPSRQSSHQREVRVFSLTQEGSDVHAAFTVARELDKWSNRDDLALKQAFVVANRPKGVSADHFLRWMREVIENPVTPDVPEHHLEAVRDAAQQLRDPEGLAVAIECSWSEATQHLWSRGQEIKRGKPRPNVYRFVGTVPVHD